MLVALLLLAANPTSVEPDFLTPTLGAAIVGAVPTLVGAGLLMGAASSKDDASAITLGMMGIALLGAGPSGAASGAAIGASQRHPVDIGVAALCGGMAGAVVGIGGGFGLGALTAPDAQIGLAYPIAGALILVPAGASVATALMVGAVE